MFDVFETFSLEALVKENLSLWNSLIMTLCFMIFVLLSNLKIYMRTLFVLLFLASPQFKGLIASLLELNPYPLLVTLDDFGLLNLVYTSNPCLAMAGLGLVAYKNLN